LISVVALHQSHLFITCFRLFVIVGFMSQSIQQPKELELLKQLIGEWAVGIVMKTPNGKVISGCGEMTATEIFQAGINSEINAHLEGYEDYYENDLWSFDRPSGKVHLFSITSEGDNHDHVGSWKNDRTLELNWRGTFEDQELEEQIIIKWLSRDQIEVREINYSLNEISLITDYVFKRKENKAT
jgi:hypothetical protein